MAGDGTSGGFDRRSGGAAGARRPAARPGRRHGHRLQPVGGCGAGRRRGGDGRAGGRSPPARTGLPRAMRSRWQRSGSARPGCPGPRSDGRRGRGRTRTPTCSSSTSPRAWWCIPGPASTRGPWSTGCSPATRRSAPWANPTGPASSTASTRARRGCCWWPASQPAYDALVAMLAARGVDRRYHALVWGTVDSATGMVDAPVGRSARDRTRMAVTLAGKDARTRYEVVRGFTDPVSVTELRCTLETGRTHQIRVHMAAIGHPVVGDERYGGVAPVVAVAEAVAARRAPGPGPPRHRRAPRVRLPAAGRPGDRAGDAALTLSDPCPNPCPNLRWLGTPWRR